MALSPTKLAQVQGMLIQGIEIPDITAQTKVSRAQVYNIRTKMEEEKAEQDFHTLSNAAPAIMSEVARGIRDRTPEAFEDDVQEVIDGFDSLSKLETRFHSSMTKILDRFDEKVNDKDIPAVELTIITNTIASAFKDIFHTKGTTINVAQAGNVGGASHLSMFQGRMGN